MNVELVVILWSINRGMSSGNWHIIKNKFVCVVAPHRNGFSFFQCDEMRILFIFLNRKDFCQYQGIWVDFQLRSHINNAIFDLNNLWVLFFADLTSETVHIVGSEFWIALSNLNFLFNPIFKTFNMNGWTTSCTLAWWYDVIFLGLALVNQTNFAFHWTFLWIQINFIFGSTFQ